jgi:mRNA-degrading endonuclease HigB of HigAB toxin-antitoxin module
MHRTLPELLQMAYPEHNWEFNTKKNRYKKAQTLLKSSLKSLFPQEGKNKFQENLFIFRIVGRV